MLFNFLVAFEANQGVTLTQAKIFLLSLIRLRLQLHGALYRPDSFVLMLCYCANLKAIRYESTSLNRIVADKSHSVIVALLCRLFNYITQELNSAYELMTDRQVKTQKCEFFFILTSLKNDDQPCVHKLNKLNIPWGIVGEMMQLITQNENISVTDSVKVMAHSRGLSLASVQPSLHHAVKAVIAINYMALGHFSISYY